ncbi:hypothetical protein Poly30_34400 [Planctomycetes bacterium Poly30]|uniref:Uncharacterized protein n=1 Tax=Saltatorellus ferox TaxID=2528018 RepID=A0A518EUY0_9BACT|nr:hypothetical protein Poly30_34400 [Planctomycetes bacterium Poly30]
MVKRLPFLWRVLKRAFLDVGRDRVLTYAAALAFYTALSLPPMIVLLLWLLGLIGNDAEAMLRGEATGLVGAAGGQLVDTVLDSADRRVQFHGVSAIISTFALVFAASGIFGQLQAALNEVWDVVAKPGAGLMAWARKRFLSIGLLGVFAFLVLVSLAASTAISALGLGESATLWARGLNFFVSVGVFSALFAAVFKFLPDVTMRWRDVWGGALLTALLFSAGKALIGFYLSAKGLGSDYGAAGSAIVVLAWVYFTSILVLFGSELTQAWLAEEGRLPVPNEHAVRVERVIGGEPATSS